MEALILASQCVENEKILFLCQITLTNDVGLRETPKQGKTGGNVHDCAAGRPCQSLPHRNHLQDRDKKDVYLIHAVFVNQRRGRIDKGESSLTEKRHALQDDFSHIKIHLF